MSEEKKKLPPRKSLIDHPDYIAETVVTKTGPCYCVFDKKTGGISHIDSIQDYVPLHWNDSLLGFVTFASTATDYGTDADLFAAIRRFIHKWSDLEDRYEALAALYAMYTWAYDEFMEVPYLRLLADLGSGKSRLGVQVLGAICYKSFKTIGASSMSPLFRTLDFLGGTLVLDEADLGDDSDKTSELVQMLNTGYLKGVPMMRSAMAGGGFKVDKFNVFGPKIIISREHFKDNALESRCLVVKLARTERKDIPFLVDESLEAEASNLRNQLLMWRFKGWGKRRDAIDYGFADLDVPPRLKQLLLLVSGILIDPEMKKILKGLATEFADEHTESRADSIEGEVAELLCSQSPGTFITCGELVDKFNATRISEKEKKNSRSMGFYIRERLGLRTTKRNNGRGIELTQKQFDVLVKKFALSTDPLANSVQTQSQKPLPEL